MMTNNEGGPVARVLEARPWLAHYEPEVPHHVEHRPRCLGDLLPDAARRFPERTAVVFSVHASSRLYTTSMRYAELAAKVDGFAASLQRLGVRPGDRVAILLPNCPQFVIAHLAAQRVGAISVPFNPLYSAREVEHQLADCGASVAVTLSQFLPLLEPARLTTALKHVVVSRIKEYFPPLLWLLYTLTKQRRQPRPRLAPGDVTFASMLGGGKPAPVTVGEDDTAVLLYTGGTTGISKGVELTHKNLMVNAEQNGAWARIGDGCEIAMAAVPLFHAFGLTCCLHLGVMTGSTLVLLPNPTDTAGLVKTIHRHRPTVLPVVPTFLIAINNLPGIEKYDLRSVRVCPCAGNPLPPAVQRTFIQLTGVHAVEGYGLTEASPVVIGNPPFGDDRHGTVGLPYPDTLARIVDMETGLPGVTMDVDGEWTSPGELVVRGPQVMKRYWNNPEATAEQIRDGWLHTGDIAQMHRDGYFRIVDRKKDMIIRSGMNIYPAEIEAVLAEHDKILEALVIGIPDETRGELVKAFVVPKPGVTLAPEEVLEHCRANLARFKLPSAVEIRTELPKSAVGKPLRRKLREEVLQRAATP
jgi:long-chain acyl-CoA synthetase